MENDRLATLEKLVIKMAIKIADMDSALAQQQLILEKMTHIITGIDPHDEKAVTEALGFNPWKVGETAPDTIPDDWKL